MLINEKQIPKELKQLDQWVVYGNTKIPYNPITSMPAKVTDEFTWARYLECIDVIKKEYFKGLGFVLKKSNNIVIIDIDNCIINDKLGINIAELINNFNNKTYIEKSPSGNGLHIILKGNWNYPKNKIGNIEVYDDKRYIAITGDRIQGDYNRLRYDENGLKYLVDNYFNN